MKRPSPLAGRVPAGLPSGDMVDRFVGESRSGAFGGVMHPGTPSRPERAWSLWKADNTAHAEISGHPLGYELRVFMNGSVLFSLVRPTRELIERDAQELKQAELEQGWTDQPPVPG